MLPCRRLLLFKEALWFMKIRCSPRPNSVTGNAGPNERKAFKQFEQDIFCKQIRRTEYGLG